MKGSSITLLPFILLLSAAAAVIATTLDLITEISFSNVGCSIMEREALLKFKHELDDPSNLLASWVADDANCCKWYGVFCDDFTNHVVGLHLGILSEEEYNATGDFDEYRYLWSTISWFGGNISPSLLNLKHLRYLNLSHNNFGGIRIPRFLGSIESLEYLDLSWSRFGGIIPHEIGNLSNLHYLNLQGIGYLESLHCLSTLRSLEFIDLSYVDLYDALDLFDVLNTLPSLVELHLSGCYFYQLNHPLALVNFSSLEILDLSSIDFSYSENSLSVPHWIFGIKTLTSLDLSINNFHGAVPIHLLNLTSLKQLDLSLNNFDSHVPNWLHGFTHLELLNLAVNNLEGRIPISIGNLTSLHSLDLSNNILQGGIPGSFKNLCNLRSLDLSNTRLSQDINEVLEILPNRLEYLNLVSSQLLGQFTNRLAKLWCMINLNVNDNLISGPIPDSLRELNFLRSLDLGNNLLSGPIPESLGELNILRNLNLGNNKLNGTLPISLRLLSMLETVDVSHNSLEGDVFEIHLENFTNLGSFEGSGNQLDSFFKAFKVSGLVKLKNFKYPSHLVP